MQEIISNSPFKMAIMKAQRHCFHFSISFPLSHIWIFKHIGTEAKCRENSYPLHKIHCWKDTSANWDSREPTKILWVSHPLVSYQGSLYTCWMDSTIEHDEMLLIKIPLFCKSLTKTLHLIHCLSRRSFWCFWELLQSDDLFLSLLLKHYWQSQLLDPK